MLFNGDVVVKENLNIVKNLLFGFKFIWENEVVVGITEDSNAFRENGISNSQLLYLHENGVPSHNIPPRPVLKPAISQDGVMERIEDQMKKGMKEALLHGNVDEARKCYEKAGMLGRDACKNYIVSGDKLAPNAPSTIEKKGSSTPLIDKASMLNSITYAVRRKK